MKISRYAFFYVLTPIFMAGAQTGTPANSRGQALYDQHCLMCHQADGMGVPPTFPPLAGSDFLEKHRERSIRAIVAGLSGQITVNGTKYKGSMPPALLDDDEVAAVLTFVHTNWGNSSAPVASEEVRKVRAKTRYPTLDVLKDSFGYPEIPPPPPGIKVRELVRLTERGSRLCPSPDGTKLLVLGLSGNIARVETGSGALDDIVKANDYIRPGYSRSSTHGMTIDSRNRLYIVVNQRNKKEKPARSDVTIFRAPVDNAGTLQEPLHPWFQISYPSGIGGFNHGVGHIAQGPDGLLYVASGSRTDSNETGKNADYFQGGETPLTSCLWRLDPEASSPEIEIFARGLRNPYGFCWDKNGRFFTTDNGPDAHTPGEFNEIKKGHHYGFPFRFADWDKKPYPHTPDPPEGTRFTDPLRTAAGLATFDPHSSPAGLVYLDDRFPKTYRNSFLTVRFGNLIALDQDVGFDLVQVRADGDTATLTQLLYPLGRPLDLALGNGPKVYLLENSRNTRQKNSGPMQPGRVLELVFSNGH